MGQINSTKDRKFRIALFVLYSLGIVSVVYFFLQGYSYYKLPLKLRIHSPMYNQWKPGGFIGHGFGILGSTMMILMLLYSLRKRASWFPKVGKLNHWLHIHIFFGIFGPLFIILHSTFKLNGLVAISFWSMIAVALSGVAGRFLYLQIPRDIFGEEISLIEAKEVENKLKRTIKTKSGMNDEAISRAISLIFIETDPQWSTLKVLSQLIIQTLTRPLKKHRLRHFLKGQSVEKQKKKEIVSIIFEFVDMHQKIELWSRIHSLFHYWHVIHRPFAYIMYLIMFVHIFIAIWLGYVWIF